MESAGALDLVEQMIQFYGPEPALGVTRKTLKRADIRDVSEELKDKLKGERGAEDRQGPRPSFPSLPPLSCFPRKVPARPTPCPRALHAQMQEPQGSDPGRS